MFVHRLIQVLLLLVAVEAMRPRRGGRLVTWTSKPKTTTKKGKASKRNKAR